MLSIELPPAIVAAINRQTQQFYEIQEFKYRVEREAQEFARKQIEANGIAAFQRTVSRGHFGFVSALARHRGDAALAQSRNSKVVIIGGGKDGLPVILGNVDGVASVSLESHGHRGRCDAERKGTGNSSGQINTLPRPTGSSPPGKNNAAAANSTPPDVTQTPTTAVPSGHSPFDLSQIKDYLQRLPDWLKSAATGPGSGAAAPPVATGPGSSAGAPPKQ